MEAATAIGVAVVEITSIKAASRWRRPDLLVVAHAKRPGYVQAIDTELNVRQDILEKYCMGEASQIDLCICNSRSDFAFSQTAFDRALIRARTGFTRLDRVCQSILEMLAPVNARALLGDDAVVGISCYGDLHRANAALAAGADYVAFGAFFASPTKPDARRAGIHLLRESADLGIPRVAIGGITPDNVRPLVAAGADLLAVISGVFDAPDPVAAARAYLSCFEDETA